ncbi:hypothetical protein CFHF_03905 [Caulobacter flavus]|jgi:hypothetical protein|uniref:Uncharacterized protein n=1 Tax=Caulobacter flavus TaxID=1679497 RepID=A0A2N5CZD3_9CAUL|nr:hypothetical protein [Caulobacter flavus]AYV45159.1 hypothetical protein C1707_02265 [Caulobacter flavus]PLR19161.1 hypothetical protein CFHF_03905 [Caulobacter flavus]
MALFYDRDPSPGYPFFFGFEAQGRGNESVNVHIRIEGRPPVSFSAQPPFYPSSIDIPADADGETLSIRVSSPGFVDHLDFTIRPDPDEEFLPEDAKKMWRYPNGGKKGRERGG